MKHIHFGLVFSGILLSGCSVMHFKNGSIESNGPIREAWHHNVAYSLMEVSKPVDLKALCEGKAWSRITTKETLVTGLAGGADNALTGMVVPGGIDIWDPQFIEWTCAEDLATAPSPAAAPALSSETPVAPAVAPAP